jgi:hypothetical protein
MKTVSERKKHWTEEVEEYVNLPIGESTFTITAEPNIVEGDYGLRLNIPTTLGNWKISNNSPLARELKKWYSQLGKLAGTTLTIVRTGEGKDSRYSLKQLQPPTQPQQAPAQWTIDANKLSPEKRREIERILYEKTQDK